MKRDHRIGHRGEQLVAGQNSVRGRHTAFSLALRIDSRARQKGGKETSYLYPSVVAVCDRDLSPASRPPERTGRVCRRTLTIAAITDLLARTSRLNLSGALGRCSAASRLSQPHISNRKNRTTQPRGLRGSGGLEAARRDVADDGVL
jgi:hypothetical protein